VDGFLGATPDYWLDAEDSDTVVEVKNASWGAWKDDWIVHEDGFVECPLRFQIQVQAQLACTGASNGILIALISGDRLVRCFMPRHQSAINAIRAKVEEFRIALDTKTPPPAEMPGDFDAAKKVWLGGDGQADMRGDQQVESWLRTLAELRQTQKTIEYDIKRIQGEVLSFCTNNKLASISADGGRISCRWRDAKPAHDRHFKEQPAHHELRITTS
jgi:predicted phage-related endonuclease